MKSVVLKDNKLIIEEKHEYGKVKVDEVVIEVNYCCVSNIDANIFNNKKGYEVNQPIVLGQEFSGTIVKKGRNVKNFRVKDKVCVDPNFYCGCCSSCKSDFKNYCDNIETYGITKDGGFQQYCIVNQKNIYKLSNKTSCKHGALADSLGRCLNSINMCDVKPGSKVVILGANYSGLLMVQLAKLKGATKIAVIEESESKRELAKKVGADLIIDLDNIESKLLKAKFDYVDIIIECNATKESINKAIDICDIRGTILFNEITDSHETIEINLFNLFKKNISIKFGSLVHHNHQIALDLIDTGRVDVTSMLYKIVPLHELNGILKNEKDRLRGKILVNPQK